MFFQKKDFHSKVVFFCFVLFFSQKVVFGLISCKFLFATALFLFLPLVLIFPSVFLMWFRFCLHAVLFKFFARFFVAIFFKTKVFFFCCSGFSSFCKFFFFLARAWTLLRLVFFSYRGFFFFAQGCYVLFATECCFFQCSCNVFFFCKEFAFFFCCKFFFCAGLCFFCKWFCVLLPRVLCFFLLLVLCYFFMNLVLCRFFFTRGFVSFSRFFFWIKCFLFRRFPCLSKSFFLKVFFQRFFWKGLFFSKGTFLFQSSFFLKKSCCCCFPHFLQGFFSSFCVFHVVFFIVFHCFLYSKSFRLTFFCKEKLFWSFF